MPEMHDHTAPGRTVQGCGGGASLTDYPPPPVTSGEILLGLLGGPNIAGRRRLQQHMTGGPAGLVLCTVGNGPRCSLSPYRGGKEALAEAALAVSCLGATPTASTYFLSGWVPQVGNASSALSDVVRGVAEAAAALGSRPVAGDVCFTDDGPEEAGPPTLVTTVLGQGGNGVTGGGAQFASEGDAVVLLGDAVPQIDGSEYQRRWFGRLEGMIPDVDLRAEVNLQQVVRGAVIGGLAHSARGCARGGLAVALAEGCLGGMGVRLNLDRIPGAAPAYGGARTDVALFGEAAPRVVLSLAPERLDELESLCTAGEVLLTVLGRVGGDSLTFEIRGEQVGVAVAALQAAYASGSAEAGE